MLKSTIICDIDGTLADMEHRRKFVDGSEPEHWRSFNESMIVDTVKEPIAILIATMKATGYYIILSSGRGEDYRLHTEEWLADNGIEYDELRMRKRRDNRKDDIVKAEMFTDEELERVLFVVDDRQQVVDMWREKGLTCLQCDRGNF